MAALVLSRLALLLNPDCFNTLLRVLLFSRVEAASKSRALPVADVLLAAKGT